MQTITWADALTRYVEGRLMTGAELAALFDGIGIESSERFEPTQIYPANEVDCIPIAAARLAAKADGSRTEFDWIWDALQLIEVAREYAGGPIPDGLRKSAIGLGLVADLAAGLIRARMMTPLVPIERPTMNAEQIEAMLHAHAEKSTRQDRRSRDATAGRDS
ncbi:MAG TPA: hypothetical protein VNT79_08375 [Phycisphaerae bacterium]|nr:hypothetical protein [Phycisphaerae bacterium]